MTAPGGKLSEASRAVGHHGAPPRHEEGSPASGTASGGTASDGEPPLPQRAMTMGRRARVAKCLAAGTRWSVRVDGRAVVTYCSGRDGP